MKTLKFPLLIVWVTFFLVACNEDEGFKQPLKEKKSTLNGVIVLKERDANSPLILSKRRKLTPPMRTKSGTEPFYNFIGKSLTTKELPLTDYRNFGWKVIDMDKYLKDYPNCYYNAPIRVSESTTFSYANFDRYLQKSKVSKKIKGGFSLDLKIFKIGAKHSMERTFSKQKINERNRVFGELHCQYKSSRHWIKNTSLDIKRMKNYVSSSFLDDLYNSSISELLDTYGRFVLCDFIVGGKAVAFYSGLYIGNTSNKTKERNMQTDINASVGFKNKDGGDIGNLSADLGFGKGFSNGAEFSHKITDIRCAVKTLGGVGGITKVNPQNISNVSIDLSNWWSSLNNSNTHSIIEISDNGLLPISNFIREDNLRYYFNEGNNIKDFVEPMLIYTHIKKLNWETIALKTRYGESVCLHSGKYINKQHSTKLLNKYSKLLKIKCMDYSTYAENVLEPLDPLDDNESGEEHPVFDYLLEGVNFVYDINPTINKIVGNSFEKYTHKNITYLVSKKTGVKFAFSIHNDYILDTYGIRTWVKNMSEVKINNLDDYTIIAL